MSSIRSLLNEAIGKLNQNSHAHLVDCTLQASIMSDNEQCWCLSGRLYKDCHKERNLKRELSEHEVRNKVSAIFDQNKYCCAEFDKENCVFEISKAHTIQKGKVLSSFAENGHVGTFYRNLNGIDNPTRLKAGIEKKASIFLGFCKYHDTELFKCIELNGFSKTKENCWASSYRAVCHEYYQKKAAIDATDWQRKYLDSGLDVYHQVFLQERLYIHQVNIEKGFSDIALIKVAYEDIKVNSQIDEIISYVLEFDAPLTIAVCASISPYFDLNGIKIQNIGYANEKFQHFSISTVTLNGNAAYVVSHLKKHDTIGNYLKEVLSMPLAYINNWLTTCIFAYTENNYFRLSWWDSLDENTRMDIYNLFLSENYTKTLDYNDLVSRSISSSLVSIERV
ncbi:metal-binding protein [Shewanella denitrificans OS217]|jgi:hypothetical protein|uniref:Metal-binding protein n=1 Tax=Shewanella denitrificans (strain OS217 / ATCC BAA-1090 / DSM 15013) TaxID=318161 RepID=Q12Q74_SHEDO|nr:SEC-C metal-binding domain-containing protein [Shewanella denitrificans]ABE54402.1 metal-binding protein [Shewanella denitrificans OS217]